MREYERIERILNLINEIWCYYPDYRFLQLVNKLEFEYSKKFDNKYSVEYTYLNEDDVPESRVYVELLSLEDDVLEEFLKEFKNNIIVKD